MKKIILAIASSMLIIKLNSAPILYTTIIEATKMGIQKGLEEAQKEINSKYLQPNSNMEIIEIIPYQDIYQDEILKIMFEDPEAFFAGYKLAANVIPKDRLHQQLKLEILPKFTNPNVHNYVILLNKTPIGFGCFYKTRDISIDDLKIDDLKNKDESPEKLEHLKSIAPLYNIKITSGECQHFILLEAIVIKNNQQGKGYGKTLLNYMLEKIKEIYPDISLIKLRVNSDNQKAIKLYEKTGFTPSKNMNFMTSTLGIYDYEMNLNKNNLS